MQKVPSVTRRAWNAIAQDWYEQVTLPMEQKRHVWKQSWKRFFSLPYDWWCEEWTWLQVLVQVPLFWVVYKLIVPPLADYQFPDPYNPGPGLWWMFPDILGAFLLMNLAAALVLLVSDTVRDLHGHYQAKKARSRPRPSARPKPGRHRLNTRKRFRS